MKNLLTLFYGFVRNRKIVLEDKNGFERTVQEYDGKEVVLTLKPASTVRSSAENRYYWGVVVRMVSDEMGVIPEEAHDYLKSLFLKVGVEKNGKRWEIIRSTTVLSTTEFEDYAEKCRMWSASELNTVIPLPNEVIVDL